MLDGQTRQPIEGIVVQLLDRGGILLQRDITRGQGRFQFLDLQPQSYIVRIESDGFESFQKSYDFSAGNRGRGLEIIRLRRKGPTVSGPRGPTVGLEELKIPKDARKAFDKGVKELHEKEDPAKSRRHFARAIEIHPEFYAAYFQLGVAHIQEQQFEPAREALVKAVLLEPDDGRAHTLLAMTHKALGDDEKMMESLREAVRLDPKNFMAHAELAEGYLASGDLKNAEAHARTAHELNPDVSGIHLILYDVAASVNDIDTAEAELIEFLEKFPDHPMAPQIRQQLEQVKQIRAAQPSPQ